jgi:tryptophan synthase alpha chain
MAFIRLTAPTTDEKRMVRVLANSSGFVYYISITGITGADGASQRSIADAVGRLRRHTALPVAVGFGIKTPDQAAEVARVADAAVVGSAIISAIGDSLNDAGAATLQTVEAAHSLVRALSAGVRDCNKESTT